MRSHALTANTFRRFSKNRNYRVEYLKNIDWITLILGAILGVIPSVLISRYYFKKGLLIRKLNVLCKFAYKKNSANNYSIRISRILLFIYNNSKELSIGQNDFYKNITVCTKKGIIKKITLLKNNVNNKNKNIKYKINNAKTAEIIFEFLDYGDGFIYEIIVENLETYKDLEILGKMKDGKIKISYEHLLNWQGINIFERNIIKRKLLDFLWHTLYFLFPIANLVGCILFETQKNIIFGLIFFILIPFSFSITFMLAYIRNDLSNTYNIPQELLEDFLVTEEKNGYIL